MAQFMLFFAFYLLMPVVPLYLMDNYHVSATAIGSVLASYTVAALVIRPFAGYMLDKYRRKPIWLCAYACFVLLFAGYAEVKLLVLFITIRVLHGLAFGLVTTAGSTVVVDIMPSQRRGEGLGYFGVANNLAMAIGPMVSLFLMEAYSFTRIFYLALLFGLAGWCLACLVQVPAKEKLPQEERCKRPALDRFFLLKGLRAGGSLMLLAVPWGLVTSFIAIYAKEVGVNSSQGVFFSLLAIGLIGSRLFSGKMVDRGRLLNVIVWGNALAVLAYFILAVLGLHVLSAGVTFLLFFGVAVLLGMAYGMMFPAYNTLFVNLAPHNRRATASSTYLTSWDVGIGIGFVCGGRIADAFATYSACYLFGVITTMLALIFFVCSVGPHFQCNKLR
ncbi:MAG: MFS transporter [Paludibacter sp.]|nr:MFS transporter [Bacteroidales bacterium]MCM1068793.1 MFS transporter [Prevotella sp.]MCM1353934.1 MFS transporter [Bacteroides sp.]MCM1443332.1 MFS transporter [Muribaculum sp.]MCM1482127.1 MFS transporter [Paludibacter sp.]